MKRVLFALISTLFLTTQIPIRAQETGMVESVPVKFSDTTWYDKGFDFHIGGGIFFGNKFNANYYNGSNLNENNLNYIFENRYWKDEIRELIVTNYPYISMTDELAVTPSTDPNGDYNWDTHYKLSTLVSFGVRYKIRDGWALNLSYSFSRMKTNAQCLLTYNGPLGNQERLPVIGIVGKEDRSTIDLTMSYLFSGMHRIVKPFIEIGIQFNYAKVKSFNAVLLDPKGNAVGNEYTLLDYYNGEGYYPGAQTYDITFGGPGFGFSGATGLKLVVSKNVSLDPTFYCYAGRTGIYQMMNGMVDNGNRFAFNYGVLLRLVMNDFFVGKNH